MSDKIGLSDERIEKIISQNTWRSSNYQKAVGAIKQALSEQEPLIRKDQMLKDAEWWTQVPNRMRDSMLNTCANVTQSYVDQFKTQLRKQAEEMEINDG